MKRTVSMAAAFVCAATIGALAQSPSTTTSSSATTTAADKITVSGCLQSAAARSTTGNSTTDAANGMADYILMTSPSSSSTTAGTTASTSTTATTGTSGTMNSSAHPGSSYMLDGRDSELKNHVGHRIEVTGTVENHGDHAAGSTATSTTTSGSASSRMSNAAPTLKVSSVRMISADCSAK